MKCILTKTPLELAEILPMGPKSFRKILAKIVDALFVKESWIREALLPVNW
jgi:hypothetical protein